MHARSRGRLPVGVWAAAGGVVVLLLAVSSRYGFHRDELYFVVAGSHPALGYVDQPALIPLAARLAEAIGGAASPWPLGVLPAVAVGGIAVTAALIARRLGGGRIAQSFSAIGVGWSGVVLGEGHLLSTAVFDFLLWSLGLLFVVMLLDGADRRWWLALGTTIGVGFNTKHTIVALAAAVLVGLVSTRRRTLLADIWPWAGVGVAAVLAAPNLVWQARHGWPQIEMSRALAARSEGPVACALLQPLLLSVVMIVPAAVGL